MHEGGDEQPFRVAGDYLKCVDHRAVAHREPEEADIESVEIVIDHLQGLIKSDQRTEVDDPQVF